MKDQFERLGQVGKYKAVGIRRYKDVYRKVRDEDDVSIYGRHGFIYMFNDTTCAAVISSARVARRFLPKEKHPLQKWDEVLIKFPVSELEVWAKRLCVTRNRSTQVKLANEWGCQ